MGYSNQFFSAIGINTKKDLAFFSKKSFIPIERLKYYNDFNLVPSGQDLTKIVSILNITNIELKIRMGRLDAEIAHLLQNNIDQLSDILDKSKTPLQKESRKLQAKFKTRLGKLYQADCLDFLQTIESDSIDLVFADPPFNLNKLYPSKIDDQIKAEKYIQWSEQWLYECIRVLAPGGALFIWNLPKWNTILSNYIGNYLNFRNWIGVDIKYSLPIQGRLYPSHYSLLYFVKGDKPKVFHPDRLPMQTCPKCVSELKNYGGYKNKMNPNGISLTDVWLDIPPVRHAKHKRRIGSNELSLKLLDRIIEMASDEGDLILDPFGGSGTTYMAAELKKRRWIGCEVGPVGDIIDRFSLKDEERELLKRYRGGINSLFPIDVRKKRETFGLWTCETL
ncbi:site-specific DNA-methyltransferase [Simiduia curdlanivorans]|uniref:site-specific DNA-methyltransferase (adenine-specific) n=1 Tax=Simiduia curdlanivorans TaxID=1492769 RepID=A0ABV8V1C7_9GAMM|nr:site-specific DNA-methyltransferase [Simiduia curdlanivorans]MDN3637969.1 site-specific DNA-methyltransferase [Simiduia curdlanivorans]